MGLYPAAIEAALVGIPRGPLSKVYLVDPETGSNTNTGLNWLKPLATVAAAYAKCVAGHHDVVLLLANLTTGANNRLSAPLVWAKDLTHLVGLCAPTSIGQRARIFQLSTLTGASPLVTISASGCIFRDLYIFQGVADATSLINVSVTGGRNHFKNVHFAGGGHATQAIDGGASLKLDAAEENLFEDCTIGVDTVDAATGMVALLLDTEAHRNEFRRCRFRIRAGNAGAAWIELADNQGIDRDTLFDHCVFMNNSATSLTSGIVIPSGTAIPRQLIMYNCMFTNVAKLDASDRTGVLVGNMVAPTATSDASGTAVNLFA